jgi:D-alanyl-D-alanine carboxypeptidase/D-alanyl-D-alanine-endopeptidase (penicillin-binding protein 4)
VSEPALERLEARGRRRPGWRPYVVLAIVALVPSLALYGVFVFADERVVDDDGVPPPPTTIVDPPLPDPPLTNGVLSFRRLSSVIARDANADEFASVVAEFVPTINDRSCAAVSVDGEDVGSRNADMPVIPASAQKVLIAEAALELLGPEHRYTTSVVASPAIADGTLDGDLVLVGGGDPVLSSDWYPGSGLEVNPVFNETSLDLLAGAVVDSGLSRITGSVIGDGTRYDDEFYAPGWGPGVAGADAGPYDALMVNDTRVRGEDQRGSDPSRAAAREFARLLTERGVVVDGPAVSGSALSYDEVVDVAEIQSEPLTRIVEEMLTASDNNTAELLVKEIGVSADPDAANTREAGLAAIVALLGQWNVDTSQIVMVDGSGLSPNNRLTCEALLEVLQRGEPDGTVGAALPVAGESGTLRDIFTDHPVSGRLLGKTGTLTNPPFNVDPPGVKALAGYLPVDGGGAVEYVLILNGPTIADQSEYRPVWDDLVDVLDTYPAGPSPADLGVIR